LWVRLLGKGSVQANAVKELLALDDDYPYKKAAASVSLAGEPKNEAK
jgi:hypothetical protein